MPAKESARHPSDQSACPRRPPASQPVPTHQLRESYASVAELEAPCEEFCEKVNTRAHRAATYSVPRALRGATVGAHPGCRYGEQASSPTSATVQM